MGEHPARITRRKLLVGTGKVAAAGAVASAIGWLEIGNPGVAVAAAQAAGEVGNATHGQNAFEYLGHVDQNGDAFTYFGYLTAIFGLKVSQLFAGKPHDETTARFTFFGTAKLTSRAVHDNVFAIHAGGTLRYYFSPDGGASFLHPASFHAGTRVAVDEATFHDVLSVTAPDTGTPNLTAFLERKAAPKFALSGTTYRFGHIGLLARSTATGLGTKLDPTPKATLTLAGDAVVTGGA
jgi:hypothetical protein